MILQSSDWLTEDRPKHSREWGHYQVVYEHPGLKVKVLTLEPGKSIPLQYHKNHDEHWLVLSGQGSARLRRGDGHFVLWPMRVGEVFDIERNRVHGVCCEEEGPLVFLEVQVGLIVPGGDAEMVHV